MRDLVHLEGPPEPEEAYGRYERWLTFAYHNRVFFETSALNLGYGIEELEKGPGNKLF
jgi:hypothetical protein